MHCLVIYYDVIYMAEKKAINKPSTSHIYLMSTVWLSLLFSNRSFIISISSSISSWIDNEHGSVSDEVTTLCDSRQRVNKNSEIPLHLSLFPQILLPTHYPEYLSYLSNCMVKSSPFISYMCYLSNCVVKSSPFSPFREFTRGICRNKENSGVFQSFSISSIMLGGSQ